jgi:ABC-type Fe3+/spermidine/putrescine transport system ATPase subunit
LQSGTRESVFRTPSSPQVAGLLGIANTHRGSTLGPGRILSEGAELDAPTGGLSEGAEVAWCVRPEHVSLNPRGRYPAMLLDDADLGTVRELRISLDGTLELILRTAETAELAIGAPLRVDLAPENITVWPLAAKAGGTGCSSPDAHPPM